MAGKFKDVPSSLQLQISVNSLRNDDKKFLTQRCKDRKAGKGENNHCQTNSDSVGLWKILFSFERKLYTQQ